MKNVQEVSWGEILTAFNLDYETNSAGQIDLSCPFHGGRTPSFRVWSGNNGFICLECGASGDKKKFVELQLGTPIDDLGEFWRNRRILSAAFPPSPDPNQLSLFVKS